ncbi:MAG: carboxymuconolactone decarboxylase family protein [Actinomycetota bacterium]|nr:carboxymuconolactone decarboxylase family protein [Actinomycetota bacterium]
MSTRLTPIPPKEWPAEMRDALAALAPSDARHPRPPRDDSRPKGLNALGTFAHHPALTKAFNGFNGHILFGTSLDLRHRELLVLRVAARRGSEYEWVQHVLIGTDVGLTFDEIERVGSDPSSAEWSPLERAVLAAADELLDDARVADGTWATLAAELDHEQLIDLVFTVGAYDLVAMFFRTFDVELDDDLRGRPGPPLPSRPGGS